jgi:hypothetical protein
MNLPLRVRALFVFFLIAGLVCGRPALAAESTTGVIYGTVFDTSGAPLSGVAISAASPSGAYGTTTDAHGRFAILGVVPDSYVVSAQRQGYTSATQSGVNVLPGEREQAAFTLAPALKTIGRVNAAGSAFTTGSPSDTFTVSGATARALAPPSSSSGLATYLSGTVQGAIESVPGVRPRPVRECRLARRQGFRR